VPTFAGRGCCVVSATNSNCRYSRFSRPEPLRFIQVAPQLSSRGWVDPVPDPLLLRKSGRVGNRTRDLWICSQKLWPLDHRGGHPYEDLKSFINNSYSSSIIISVSSSRIWWASHVAFRGKRIHTRFHSKEIREKPGRRCKDNIKSNLKCRMWVVFFWLRL
jgi:hypothetical protein